MATAKAAATQRKGRPSAPSSTTAAGPAPTSNQAAGSWRVRIRMYRQGIGDSFLLTLRTGSADAHILIDCGVLTGTKNAAQWTQAIAQNVRAATGGRVNAIVGTHPHWDHLSGFSDAKAQFDQLATGEVWLSWAENPQDEAARTQKKQLALQLDTAAAAATHLAALGAADAASAAGRINAVLDFLGPAVAGAARGSGTEQALQNLRQKVAKPTYLEPGALLQPPWLKGVTIYVLGPPRDPKYLHKMLGSVGTDMYELGPYRGLCAGLQALRGGAGASGSAAVKAMLPFEDGKLVKNADASRDEALAELVAAYSGAPWRQIPSAWLLAAEVLAVNYDNAVNNLSLALAFEFDDTKEVLLFPADAQVGNWQSWQNLKWQRPSAAGAATVVTADALLARTIFYKVGHHGSHNATLMDHGLEVMSSPELIAAIPVNQAFANNTKKWKMPADGVYKRLQQKTFGRLLRSDGSGPTATDAGNPVQPSVAAAFASRVQVATDKVGDTPLYVDCFIP